MIIVIIFGHPNLSNVLSSSENFVVVTSNIRHRIERYALIRIFANKTKPSRPETRLNIPIINTKGITARDLLKIKTMGTLESKIRTATNVPYKEKTKKEFGLVRITNMINVTKIKVFKRGSSRFIGLGLSLY